MFPCSIFRARQKRRSNTALFCYPEATNSDFQSFLSVLHPSLLNNSQIANNIILFLYIVSLTNFYLHNPLKKAFALSRSFLSGCPFDIPPISLNGPNVSYPLQENSPTILPCFSFIIPFIESNTGLPP